MKASLPLSGIRVTELGHFISAPFCGQLLADQGADVIKVEGPDARRDRGAEPIGYRAAYFYANNRNKRSVQLDLKTTFGKRALAAVIASSDVLITNFAPNVPSRLGFGAAEMTSAYSRLVYVHVTGFGSDGPYSGRLAFDGVIQAMSGLLHMTGEPDGPPMLAGMFIPDHLTGVYAALATMMALRQRDLTGRGSIVDIRMLDCMLSFMGSGFAEVLQLGKSPARVGSRVRESYAGTYAAKDGYVYLAPLTAKMWESLASLIGEASLLDFFSTTAAQDRRLPARPQLDVLIEGWTRGRTVEEVVAAMETVGVACGPILSVDELVCDPYVEHRKMVRNLEAEGGGGEIAVVGSAIPTSDESFAVRPPFPGEHTDEILAELGFDAQGQV